MCGSGQSKENHVKSAMPKEDFMKKRVADPEFKVNSGGQRVLNQVTPIHVII